MSDRPLSFDGATPVEIHLGGPQRPVQRFALRPSPRSSRRSLFLDGATTLPAVVLPLLDRLGREVHFASLAEVLDGVATPRTASWLFPARDEAPATRVPAAWVQGLDEAAADALVARLQLEPGLLITADERCRPLGNATSPTRFLVPLPRIVLAERECIADNTDAALSMDRLLDHLARQFVADGTLRHLRLATGYLYSRGLYRLLRLLAESEIEEMCILFSGHTDAPTARLLTGRFSGAVAEAVEEAGDAQLAEVCRAALESGRLKVRAYADAFLHAKLFLGWRQRDLRGRLVGHAVVGSSNLSQGGLAHGGNLELDVLIDDAQTLESLKTWFEARWEEGDEPEPSLLTLVDNWRPQPEPAFVTPGLLEVWRAGRRRQLAAPDRYLALLARLYGRRAAQVRPVDLPPYPDDVPRTLEPSPEQVSGVQNLTYRLRASRLAFLADSVGLGKTVTALGAAWLMQRAGLVERFAVVAPRKLHHQWRADAARLGMARDAFDCLNRHKLERDDAARARTTLSSYQLVLVDEAHETLRNRSNKLWGHLRGWLAHDPRAMLLLISATPWNNSREDIFNYLALAWADYVRLEPHFPAVRDVDLAVFKDATAAGARRFLEMDQGQYERLFGTAFLQRTRSGVARRYGAAPDFPERDIHARTTPPSEPHDAFFAALDDALQALAIPYREPFAAMQRALAAVDPAGKAPAPSNLQGSFVLQLYKRAESSLYALAVSLERIGVQLRAFRATLEQIERASDPKHALSTWLREVYLRLDPLAIAAEEADEDEGDEEGPFRLRPSTAEETRRANLESLLARLDAAAVLAAVRHLIEREVEVDLAVLDRLRAHLGPDLDRADPKALELFRPANTHYGAGHQPILVAAFSDTATRFFLRLVQRLPDARIGLALGGGEAWVYRPGARLATDLTDDEWRASLAWTGADRRARLLGGAGRAQRVERDDLLAAFAPRAQARGDAAIDRAGGPVDILVGSEAISVGQNLQDSTALIHLDLPWNPMVLEQRIGRVDRRGGGRPDPDGDRKIVDVHYCWSTAAVEAEVNLRERLKEKVGGAMRDTHFDEPLLYEMLEQVRRSRDDAERRDKVAHVLGQRQRDLVEARERVAGTDERTGAEIDGLRLLAEWMQGHPAHAEASPDPEVIACGQTDSGAGPAAQWLVTLRVTPTGGTPQWAHVAVPAGEGVDALRPDLDAVVGALTGAGAPAASPGVDRATWTRLALELDRALEAARQRTLTLHNAEVQAAIERSQRARGAREASEQLRLAALRAGQAVREAAIRDPRLPKGPHGERVKTLLRGALEPANAWRLTFGRDEDVVRQWLDRVACQARWFWTDGFEEVWAAVFEGTDEPQETPPALVQAEQKWQDLGIEVVAASFVRG